MGLAQLYISEYKRSYRKLLCAQVIGPKDHRLTMAECKNCVAIGLFIDDDGRSYYATDSTYFRNLPAYPRLVKNGFVWEGFTYIVWFNK